MARGFTDSNGKFRPTGNGKRISNREKALRTAGIPIDDFDTSFLRTTEGDRLLAERVERQRLKKIEVEKEERRVDFLAGKIRDIELEFGNQLLIGQINSPLSTPEWIELNNLLVDEVESEFDPSIHVNKIRIEELMSRMTFNEQDELRSIQGDGHLRKDTVEDFDRRKKEFNEKVARGDLVIRGDFIFTREELEEQER